jgi:predicted esterase
VPDTREDNWVWSPQGIIDMHRPERWGIVEFSKESPSAATLSPDVSLPARDVLMEVYHRQKSYHAKEGRWAGSLTELGMQMPALDVFPKPLELRTTDDGFHATLVHSLADGKTETWHVRQDSRLWRSDSQSRRAGPVLPDESGKARLASRAETPNSPAASNAISDALSRAGENRPQIQKALDDAPAGQRAAMEFLVAHMPDRDLASLTADYLLENVRLACQARDESPWKEQIPEEIFLNNVLPYASINERRDAWRKDFYDRCRPLVEGAKSPSLAAAMLNQKIYKLLNVRYSTGRPKADQSPFESIQAGTASCSGLAVLLIDACRAVGVPARFVGTPLWADGSGNHSWVEVWDQGWHFTGAAEPSGDRLDEAWFLGRASKAQRDDPRHAIYAVSYQRTPLKFPLVWDRRIDYVFAVNVTDRYVGRGTKPPVGTIETMFRVLNAEGQRCAATIVVRDAARKTVFEGTAKDERFDANDHALAHLVPGEYRAEIRFGDCSMVETFKAEPRKAPVTWRLPQARVADESPRKAKDDARASESTLSAAAVEELASYLKQSADERPPLDKQPFASVALSCGDATVAAKLLWDDHAATIRKTRSAEMEARLLTLGDLKMPFTYQIFGEKPATGRSLYISMHGGGGAPKSVNDRQWENQKRLYKLEEGVYLVPRAPTDTWNLWHQEHIDKFFDRLIENLVVLEDVDPDRVYIMGYSAGGDGVYQLAPRMADRLAAAAMMAGHPNETSPLGLRNLPFTLHVGALDAAYDRNKVARQWEQKLADLHRDDPQGYEHLVKIHADKGHWMDREDAVAIGWMARHRRNLLPERIVWKQDDVAHTRFYWLAVGPKDFRERAEVVAQRSGQRVDLQTKDVDRLTVRAADELFDLDEPITITRGGQTLFEGRLARTIATLAKTLSERGDPRGMFSAEVRVEVPSSATP